MLDFVTDHLCNETDTLMQCCLVSKSWVSRTRKHLFAVIMFNTRGYIEAWKRTFPVSSDSPARHTRVLVIHCPGVITAADGADHGLIRTFSHLVCLEVNEYADPGCGLGLGMNLAPFYNVPPVTLKSLSVASPSALPMQVVNLICSLPFLEDLTLIGGADDDSDGPDTVVPSSSSPPFTGTLVLYMVQGVASMARRLLNLPNGLNFQKLQSQCYRTGDLPYIVDLVTACSGTLKFLDITYAPAKGMASFCWTNRSS